MSARRNASALREGGLAILLILLAPSAPARAAWHALPARHVPRDLGGRVESGALAPEQTLHLTLSLPLADAAGLVAFLAAQADPHSPDYHRYLSPEAFAERFGPTPSARAAVEDYVRAQGLTVVAEAAGVVEVLASPDAVERAFRTRIRRYVGPDASSVYAPDVEPTLPDGVDLLRINGLDNLTRPRRLGTFRPGSRRASRPAPAYAGAGGAAFAGGDFRAIYLPGVAATGAGETLALFEVDGVDPGDLAVYGAQTGIAPPPVSIQGVDGYDGTVRSADDELETAMDLEVAASMAPGLAQLRVVETDPDNFDPVAVLAALADPPDGQALPREISCSWTWSGSAWAPAVSLLLAQLAAQGQTFVQASGDLGAYVAGDPDATPPDPLVDSPYLCAVGGTVLTAPNGAYVSESTWNDPADKPGNAASGGGVCPDLDLPAWQAGLASPANGASSQHRNLPDVAMVSAAIYVVGDHGNGFIAGGTSAAAPLWAGLLALAAQAAAPAPLGEAVPLLYAAAGDGPYFHDIADGSTNNYAGGPSSGAYAAVPGYDLATGLGSPAPGLVAALAALARGGPLPAAPTPGPTPAAAPVPDPGTDGNVGSSQAPGAKGLSPTPEPAGPGAWRLSAGPNPASGRAVVELAGAGSDQATLRAYSLAGGLLGTWPPQPAPDGGQRWSVDVSGFAPGVVLLLARAPGGGAGVGLKLAVVR